MKKTWRSTLVWIVAAVLLLLPVSGAFGDDGIAQKLKTIERLPSKFTFVVLGDNRAGDPACDAIYKEILSAALARKPDFMVNTGDQINKPGNIEHWKQFWKLSKNVRVPYFLTVGNHDAHVDVPGSEETYKDQVDLPGKEIYYSFTAGNSLFIVLDSYIKGEDKKITGEQYRWLENVLSMSKHKHKFVFVHHPLFPVQGIGKHYGNSLDRYPEERDRLHGLFRKYGVKMVFNGHEHLYLRKIIDGIPYVITGGGGAPLYADQQNGGFYHYVLMTVDGDRASGEVIDMSGKIRDRF